MAWKPARGGRPAPDMGQQNGGGGNDFGQIMGQINAGNSLGKSAQKLGQPTEGAGKVPPKNGAGPQFVAPNLGEAPGWWQNAKTRGAAGNMYAQAMYGGLQSQADAQNQFTGQSALETLKAQHEADAATLKQKHEQELAILNQTGDVRKAMGIPLGPEGDAMFATLVGVINERNQAKLGAETASLKNTTKAANYTNAAMDDPEWVSANRRGAIGLAEKPEVENKVNLTNAEAAKTTALAHKGQVLVNQNTLDFNRTQPKEVGPGSMLVNPSYLTDHMSVFNPGIPDIRRDPSSFMGLGGNKSGGTSDGSITLSDGTVIKPRSQVPQPKVAPAPPITPLRNSFTPTPRGMDQNYVPTGAQATLAPVKNVGGFPVQNAEPAIPGDQLKKLLQYLGQAAYGIGNDDIRKQLDQSGKIWDPTWSR